MKLETIVGEITARTVIRTFQFPYDWLLSKLFCSIDEIQIYEYVLESMLTNSDIREHFKYHCNNQEMK